MSDIRFVGIYLDKALANPGSEWDLVLQEGDRLIVPLFNNTVSVQGEVMYPNTVGFKKGEKLKYYINQSGGFSLKAKKDRVFAIHMNGTVTRVKSAKDIGLRNPRAHQAQAAVGINHADALARHDHRHARQRNRVGTEIGGA